MTEIPMDILADGTVKWKTGKIPGEHHDAADKMLDELDQLLGGEVKRERHAARPREVHTDDHQHTHEHNH